MGKGPYTHGILTLLLFRVFDESMTILQLNIVETLLELGNDGGAINKQNGHGSTALHTALQLKHLDVFDRLLEAGADPNIKVSCRDLWYS